MTLKLVASMNGLDSQHGGLTIFCNISAERTVNGSFRNFCSPIFSASKDRTRSLLRRLTLAVAPFPSYVGVSSRAYCVSPVSTPCSICIG